MGVTTWYAFLTRQVAEANAASAEQARIAAEASLAAVAATEASVEVEFGVEPRLGTTLGKVRDLLEQAKASGSPDPDATIDLTPVMRFSGVDITGRGAAVYVHACRLDSVGRRSSDDARFTESVRDQVALNPPSEVPHRLHKGELMSFSLDPDQPADKLVELKTTIFYSFASEGAQYARQVSWTSSKRSGGAAE
ncbi:hypothetical protein [Modestobacter sp. NPDC049651]|uniref:hypothetical protein n=1 Tax=unclassified Modestobacter TaxID=2643866 RepID=UPI0033FF921F